MLHYKIYIRGVQPASHCHIRKIIHTKKTRQFWSFGTACIATAARADREPTNNSSCGPFHKNTALDTPAFYPRGACVYLYHTALDTPAFYPRGACVYLYHTALDTPAFYPRGACVYLYQTVRALPTGRRQRLDCVPPSFSQNNKRTVSHNSVR
jgi:hypothetical protein